MKQQPKAFEPLRPDFDAESELTTFRLNSSLLESEGPGSGSFCAWLGLDHLVLDFARSSNHAGILADVPDLRRGLRYKSSPFRV